MFRRGARAERRARAESARLGRQADEYARQAGEQPSDEGWPEPPGGTYTVEKDGVTFNWSELGLKAMEAGGYDTSQILGSYGQQATSPERKLYGEELDEEIDRLAATLPPEPGSPSDWRNFEASEHPDQSAVNGEYRYLTDIANAREDYLHTTSEATRLDAWDELKAAEQDLQRYRDGLEPGRDAGRWSPAADHLDAAERACEGWDEPLPAGTKDAAREAPERSQAGRDAAEQAAASWDEPLPANAVEPPPFGRDGADREAG